MANKLSFSVISFGKVDREKGAIFGVSVITGGVEALGHGVFTDKTTLEQVKKCAETYKNGLKVKLDHGSGAGSICGRLTNFKIEGDKLTADLQLLENYEHKDYLLELAEAMPESFGLSISFSGEYFNAPDGRWFARCAEIYSCDIVDQPAANPSGLFSVHTVDTPKKDMPTETPVKEEPKAFSITKEQFESLQAELKSLKEVKKEEPKPAELSKEEILKGVRDIVVQEFAKVGGQPAPVAPQPPVEKKDEPKPKNFEQLLEEKTKELGSRAKASSFIVKNHPKEHLEYLQKIGVRK